MKEKQMKDAFDAKAQEIMETIGLQKQEVPKIGIEVEYAVIDNQGKPALNDYFLENVLNAYPELGRTQIEIATPPIIVDNISNLEVALDAEERILKEGSNGTMAARLGAIPNMNIKDIEVTPKKKYKIVPTFHDDRRGDHVATKFGGVNFNQANILSIMSSTQFNMQADSLDDAVDKTNRSLMISPYLVAVSGNARVVEGKDTQTSDIRMISWELSHETRTPREILENKETRIGTPRRYFTGIKDYFDRCSSHPFILDNKDFALEIGIGLYWLDTRIKFIDNKPVVEYRAMSTQPTAKEDVAMAAFYMGRLNFSQKTNEPLLDMEQLHANRKSAMYFGLDGMLFSGGKKVSAQKALANEVKMAEQGLSMLGFREKEIKEYTNIINERINRKEIPSDKFVREIMTKPINEAVFSYKV